MLRVKEYENYHYNKKKYNDTMQGMWILIGLVVIASEIGIVKWWIKARTNEESLKQYVYEKFERDYYPRIILQGREKIDLDKSGIPIKEKILDNLKCGNFGYEFLPEDENVKESYSISNGNVHFHPRRRKINSRLLIKLKM